MTTDAHVSAIRRSAERIIRLTDDTTGERLTDEMKIELEVISEALSQLESP